MLKVAADLSIARDIPLETAFTALTKSLKGSSIAIAQFIPELADLSAEQNKAGVALEYLDSQYSGFAARNLETFSGKIKAQKGAWGELLETIGGIASEIFDIGNSIDSTTGKINSLNDSITVNRMNWIAFGQALVSLFKGIADVIAKSFMAIVGTIERTLGVAISVFGYLQSAADKFGKRTDMGASISKFGEELYAMGQKNKDAFDDLNINLKATDGELKTVSNTVVKTKEELIKAKNAAKDFNDKLQNAELLKKIEDYRTALALAGKSEIDLVRAKEVEDL
ncbi:MAG: hypothetical protein NTV82_02290, partial [Candidatus Aminicenantes bacterium]|nr:hypothetical protein [Candidatus Aminicenantes bacterium]